MVHKKEKKIFQLSTLVPKDSAENTDQPLNFIKINPWHPLIASKDLQIR